MEKKNETPPLPLHSKGKAGEHTSWANSLMDLLSGGDSPRKKTRVKADALASPRKKKAKRKGRKDDDDNLDEETKAMMLIALSNLTMPRGSWIDSKRRKVKVRTSVLPPDDEGGQGGAKNRTVTLAFYDVMKAGNRMMLGNESATSKKDPRQQKIIEASDSAPSSSSELTSSTDDKPRRKRKNANKSKKRKKRGKELIGNPADISANSPLAVAVVDKKTIDARNNNNNTYSSDEEKGVEYLLRKYFPKPKDDGFVDKDGNGEGEGEEEEEEGPLSQEEREAQDENEEQEEKAKALAFFRESSSSSLFEEEEEEEDSDDLDDDDDFKRQPHEEEEEGEKENNTNNNDNKEGKCKEEKENNNNNNSEHKEIVKSATTTTTRIEMQRKKLQTSREKSEKRRREKRKARRKSTAFIESSPPGTKRVMSADEISPSRSTRAGVLAELEASISGRQGSFSHDAVPTSVSTPSVLRASTKASTPSAAGSSSSTAAGQTGLSTTFGTSSGSGWLSRAKKRHSLQLVGLRFTAKKSGSGEFVDSKKDSPRADSGPAALLSVDKEKGKEKEDPSSTTKENGLHAHNYNHNNNNTTNKRIKRLSRQLFYRENRFTHEMDNNNHPNHPIYANNNNNNNKEVNEDHRSEAEKEEEEEEREKGEENDANEDAELKFVAKKLKRAKKKKAFAYKYVHVEPEDLGTVDGMMRKWFTVDRLDRGSKGVFVVRVKLLLEHLRVAQLTPKIIKNILSPALSDYGFVHAALQIGPYIIEWGNDSLVCPRPVENYAPPLLLADFPNGLLYQGSDYEEVTKIYRSICEKAVQWNRKKNYATVGIKMNPQQGHCQHFLHEIVDTLGLDEDSFDEPLRGFLANLKKRGSGEMAIVDPFTREKIVFETHTQLDDYVRKMMETHCPDLENEHPGMWQLLKAFDRAFWAISPTAHLFDISLTTFPGCPFGSPRRNLSGSFN